MGTAVAGPERTSLARAVPLRSVEHPIKVGPEPLQVSRPPLFHPCRSSLWEEFLGEVFCVHG